MAFRVPRCCFCFDLKYGFLTFGIICLIFRVIAITMLWGTAAATSNLIANLERVDDAAAFYWVYLAYNVSLTPALGYVVATTILLIIALRGIMMEKSILMFPYIVVLVIEIIANSIFHTYLVAMVTAMFLISLLISVGINFYILLCIWSLYKEIAQREENAKASASVRFTNAKVPIVI